jgi:hypothetical protein
VVCTAKSALAAAKELSSNWKQIVIEYCTSNITVSVPFLAKLLNISARTLHTRMKKDGDELGDLIRASRGWLQSELEAKALTKARSDDASLEQILRVLGRVNPEAHHDGVLSSRASKGPTVNIDQRQQAFFPRSWTREELAKLQQTTPALEPTK